MDIPAYRKDRGLTQADVATLLTEAGYPATQSLVSQWEKGDVTLTPERVIQIEQVTEGAIQRSDLRPDLWPAEKVA